MELSFTSCCVSIEQEYSFTATYGRGVKTSELLIILKKNRHKISTTMKTDELTYQEIHDVVKRQEWDNALELLTPVQITGFNDLLRHNISLLRRKFNSLRRKIDTPETSLITTVLYVSKGALTSSAKKLCLRLIEIGGMDVLRQGEGSNAGTALHALLAWPEQKFCLDLFHKMLEVGGQDLLLMVDMYGHSVLHRLCRTHTHSMSNLDGTLFDVVEKLLVVGGEKLLFLQDDYHYTALHLACDDEEMNISLIHMLIDFGRDKLVMMTTDLGASILADPTTLEKFRGCEELINRLLEVGGSDYYERCKLIMCDNESELSAAYEVSRFDYFMYE